jgi:hypothetical protein
MVDNIKIYIRAIIFELVNLTKVADFCISVLEHSKPVIR